MRRPHGRVVLVVLAACALFLFSSFSVPEAAGRLAGGGGGSDAAELLMRTRRLMPDEREEYYRTAGSVGVRPVGDPTAQADTALPAFSRATATGGGAPAAQPAARGHPLPAAGRPVRDRPTTGGSDVPVTGDAAPGDATDACFGCNGGERPGPLHPLTGCNIPPRPYHTLLTSSSGTYQLWQSRVMHHHFVAQRARDPCGEMAGFTRLHTTRDAVPDAFGAEMHTVTVKEGHGAYPVVNRPSSVVQFVDGGHLDRIQEDYIFIAETDHIFLRPMPNLATEHTPAAFHFGYMVADGQARIVDKFVPGLGGKTDPIGPSPLLIHKDLLRRLAKPWLDFTLKICDDREAVQALGWVREMWGYAIAAASLGIKHLVLDALQFEGGSIGNRDRQLAWPVPALPVGTEGPQHRGSRMPYYLVHYTYGIEYSREGIPMELQVGEWSLDKRHYMGHYPPTALLPPPACAHDRAFVLTQLINNASAALTIAGTWPDAKGGSPTSYHTLPLRAPPASGTGPGSISGTGPWSISGVGAGRPFRLDGVFFLGHGFVYSSKGHGRWAPAGEGDTIDVQVCAHSMRLRLVRGTPDVPGWRLQSEGNTGWGGRDKVQASAALAAPAEAMRLWALPPRPAPDETTLRVEGTGPYRGPAGSAYLLRAGVLLATGREIGQFRRWRALTPWRLLFYNGADDAAAPGADPATAAPTPAATADCARGVCVELTDCFVLRLPPPPPGLLDPLGLAAPPRVPPARSLEWILRPPATVCEDPCGGLTLRKLTPADGAASALARALQASTAQWTWAGFGGLRFEAGGRLATPWGAGVWGAPPEAQGGNRPALLAEFAGQQHLLRARLASGGRVMGMESTRCHDNDRAPVALASGEPPILTLA